VNKKIDAGAAVLAASAFYFSKGSEVLGSRVQRFWPRLGDSTELLEGWLLSFVN
jgi:hypothetical protein